MKLIIEEANINMEIDKDQFYSIFKDGEENNIKISEDLAKDFHDGYTFKFDKIDGVDEPQDLSSMNFNELVEYLEGASMANLDKIVADYTEKANSYYLQKIEKKVNDGISESINDLKGSVDAKDTPSQVSDISGDESPPSKDLLDVLREVTMSVGQKGIAILKEDINSYRRVEINDIEKITGDHKYTQEELNNINAVFNEVVLEVEYPSKWLLVYGDDNKLKACDIETIEFPKDDEIDEKFDDIVFVANKIKEHYGETTENKTQDKEEESADNDLYNGFLLLTLLVLCFVIVSHWTTISQFIAPALSWITNICFPALVAFFSTNVGIGVAVTLGVLALAGVVTAIVLSNGSNEPIKKIKDDAKPTGSSGLNENNNSRLPASEKIGLKEPGDEKRIENNGVGSNLA